MSLKHEIGKDIKVGTVIKTAWSGIKPYEYVVIACVGDRFYTFMDLAEVGRARKYFRWVPSGEAYEIIGKWENG